MFEKQTSQPADGQSRPDRLATFSRNARRGSKIVFTLIIEAHLIAFALKVPFPVLFPASLAESRAGTVANTSAARAPARFEGVVLDQGRRAAKGATVVLTHVVTGQSHRASVDAAGEFRIEELRPGRYRVVGWLNGEAVKRHRVRLTGVYRWETSVPRAAQESMLL